MPVYLTPGVYRRPQPVETGRLQLVRTDVAGFVGFAERGPLPRPDATLDQARDAAVRLTSWGQFRAIFGGFVPHGYLAYAVRAFFDNGGAACYVVRVAALKPGKDVLPPRAASIRVPTLASLSGGHPTGVPFAAEVKANGLELEVSDEAAPPAEEMEKIQTGDLVQIKSAGGVTEVSWVVGRKGKTLTLPKKLAGAHTGGVTVTGYMPGLVVTARSPGGWGNRINLAATPLRDQEFALRVTLMPGPDPSAPVEEEYYNRLSVDTGPFFVLDRVNAFSNLITLDAPAPLPIPPLFFGIEERATAGTLQDMAQEQRDAFNVAYTVLLRGGDDGLNGLTVEDFTGGTDVWRGLRILEEIDEVSILCAPDAVFERPSASPVQIRPPANPSVKVSPPDHPPGGTGDQAAIPPHADTVTIYQAMIDQCERLHDRIAILDCPQNTTKFSDLYKWRETFYTRFAALYYPWLDVPDPLAIDGALRRVPAAGHVAGVYARIDNQFGVHRPPANAELEFVTDVADRLTDLGQQRLNPYGINVIRSFPKRGVRVWGARSLAAPDDTDWQFIHARRLMSMIEESLSKSMQWAVFEPNDFTLRQTLVHSISVFLETVWRSGGLKGSRPADGFYVKCDETNNPPAVVDAGQIICEVGVAIAAPMEFLVFEIRRNPGTTEISES
jgi:hypothetical protein